MPVVLCVRAISECPRCFVSVFRALGMCAMSECFVSIFREFTEKFWPRCHIGSLRLACCLLLVVFLLFTSQKSIVINERHIGSPSCLLSSLGRSPFLLPGASFFSSLTKEYVGFCHNVWFHVQVNILRCTSYLKFVRTVKCMNEYKSNK